MKVYITIAQRIEGNEQTGFGTYFYSDLRHFVSRQGAQRYGLRQYDSDDFNIGTVEGGKLVAFGGADWDFGDPGHYEDEPHGGYDLGQIAEQLYLANHRWPS